MPTFNLFEYRPGGGIARELNLIDLLSPKAANFVRHFLLQLQPQQYKAPVTLSKRKGFNYRANYLINWLFTELDISHLSKTG